MFWLQLMAYRHQPATLHSVITRKISYKCF